MDSEPVGSRDCSPQGRGRSPLSRRLGFLVPSGQPGSTEWDYGASEMRTKTKYLNWMLTCSSQFSES